MCDYVVKSWWWCLCTLAFKKPGCLCAAAVTSVHRRVTKLAGVSSCLLCAALELVRESKSRDNQLETPLSSPPLPCPDI